MWKHVRHQKIFTKKQNNVEDVMILCYDKLGILFCLRVRHMKKIIEMLQEYSVPLIVGIAAALVWANLSPESYEHFIHFSIFGDVTIHFLVEDIFMVFFFCHRHGGNCGISSSWRIVESY